MNDPEQQIGPTGFDFNRPTIVALLYLGTFVTGISGIVGVILAHVWRDEPHSPWEAAHYTYLIRTFWLALAAMVTGTITTLIGIGFIILFCACIWFLVRIVKSLIRAQNQMPMEEPQTLLF